MSTLSKAMIFDNHKTKYKPSIIEKIPKLVPLGLCLLDAPLIYAAYVKNNWVLVGTGITIFLGGITLYSQQSMTIQRNRIEKKNNIYQICKRECKKFFKKCSLDDICMLHRTNQYTAEQNEFFDKDKDKIYFEKSDKIDLLEVYFNNIIKNKKTELNENIMHDINDSINDSDIKPIKNITPLSDKLASYANAFTREKIFFKKLKKSFEYYMLNHTYDNDILNKKATQWYHNNSKTKNTENNKIDAEIDRFKKNLTDKQNTIYDQKKNLCTKMKYLMKNIITDNMMKNEFKKRIITLFELYEYIPIVVRKDIFIDKFHKIIQTIQNINNNKYSVFTKLYNFKENKNLERYIENIEYQMENCYQACYRKYTHMMKDKESNYISSKICDLTCTLKTDTVNLDNTLYEPLKKEEIEDSALLELISLLKTIRSSAEEEEED